MDKATLRPHVFEILKMMPQTHFHAIENEVRRRVETYERHDVLILQELLWELLMQGVLAPGKNSLNLNLPFVHVTEYGATCLDDGRILLHDPDAYIARFVTSAGEQVDAVIIQLVREALESFLNGNRTASIVMLSLAAEWLFAHLLQALIQTDAIDKAQAQILEALPPSSGQRVQAVIHAVREGSLAPEDEAAALPHLNGLATPLQLVRTDAGTPRWIEPSHDQVLGLFLLFPEQCAFVYHLELLLRKADVST